MDQSEIEDLLYKLGIAIADVSEPQRETILSRYATDDSDRGVLLRTLMLWATQLPHPADLDSCLLTFTAKSAADRT